MMRNCCSKVTILIILFLAIQPLVKGQTKVNQIDSLIARLSWKSISMDCIATMLMLTHEDSAEKALIKIGKPATKKLIKALDDTGKTVIAHIILTQIWGTPADRGYFSEISIHKNCNQLMGTHFFYNGLVWEWDFEREETIRRSEVAKIKRYWVAKLVNKRNVSLNRVQIIKEVERQDNLLYPCNKVYKNNSGNVKYADLCQLLDKKCDNPLFKQLWNRFGNDSTVDRFDDSFYITYDFEGLSFAFDQDSTLNTIFVEDDFKGELPYKLKLTDLKPVVESKIGKPFESKEYGDSSWGWYKDKSLYLDFDKEGKITKFGISNK